MFEFTLMCMCVFSVIVVDAGVDADVGDVVDESY